VSERHARTERDRRRRVLGQNFLVDTTLIDLFVDGLGIGADDLVVDLGAGTGALTLPLARTGATVWAVESDPDWIARLRTNLSAQAPDVRVIAADIRRLRLPRVSYRVVANPPFGITTELLSRLLDDPSRGPDRADLIVQHEVARKHATTPPVALRTAAWAPWWTFEIGMRFDRDAFRPRPSVDASQLTLRKRMPALLPDRLAPDFVETLRPSWTGGATRPSRRPST